MKILTQELLRLLSGIYKRFDDDFKREKII